jgi:ABC-type thiamine transport system substrate-binding protein
LKIQTVNYRTAQGWSEALDTALDGPQTLVLAFAAPEFSTHAQPFEALAAAFPQAVLTGCSGAAKASTSVCGPSSAV